jgi:peptidoglycan L-alanyl-D-glutamate endopeptidase CwlK
MKDLTPRELTIINGLYPPMREDAKAVALEAAEIGAFLFCGYRSYDEQLGLWLKGRDEHGKEVNLDEIVTWARPGTSWHQYGLATDYAFGGPGAWNWRSGNPWEELGKIYEKHRFHWAGRWRRKTDKPHGERNYGFTIEDLKAIYERHGQLSDVWSELNNYAFKG